MSYGGDEFVCILPGAIIAGAEKRLTHVNTTLAQPSQRGAVTIGLAELDPQTHLQTWSPADAGQLYRERQNRFQGMRQTPR